MTKLTPIIDSGNTLRQMSLLYELSLSIGHSLDLAENCDRFLKVLMARKNFDCAAVWIKDIYLTHRVNADSLILVYANPECQATDRILDANHPLVTAVDKCDYLTISSEEQCFNQFITERGVTKGSYIIIPLGKLGMLKLFTSDSKYVYDDTVARILRNVFVKFAVSLEGCISHDKLAVQINISMQKEAELKKIHDELEHRVLARTRELLLVNEALQDEIRVRETTEHSLNELRNSFQALVENAPDIIVRIDRNMRYLYANPAIELLTEVPAEQIIGKPYYEIKFGGKGHILFQESVQTVFKTGQGIRYESEYSNTNGVRCYQTHLVPEFRGDGSVETVLGISRDITKQQHLEKEMARLDRLNLIGEMAASIGHEVRNPMTTVRGFLQLYEMKLEIAKDKENFSLMIEEIDRANSIITEFLSLAHNKAINLQSNNLNEIIAAIFPLIQADGLCRGNNVLLDLSPIPNLMLDAKEIRQCILNMVCNAWEAMPRGGTVFIKTFMDGNDTVLSVTDQGSGIVPQVLDKLGTPFITTKEAGTGLGLAVCYSIAARHKARIEFTTTSQGTTFYIRFN